MDRRSLEALVITVGLGEEVHQFAYELRRPGADLLNALHDIGGCQGLVGQIQSDHDHRPGFVEDDVSRFRVDLDIEFSHCRPVAGVVAAAHQHHFANALDDAWFLACRQRDIGQGAGGHQGDFTWLVAHHQIDDDIHRVALIEFDR